MQCGKSPCESIQFFILLFFFNLGPRIAIYLYSSALLAFAAGVLDLSQILGRGQLIDQGGVNGLVNTREVALSLSVGFRFLFYWSFIAERPRGEPPPPNPEELDVRYNPRIHTHSADWQRWGYLGLFLKWGLLALTFSIPILHIVWRILARRFALVYMVETTIEIVVTSIFILKIFLNLFLSPVFPWWKLTSWYITPIIALGLNLGVAAGNLGYCKHTISACLFSVLTNLRSFVYGNHSGTVHPGR